ncbi:hypothetical protein E2562_036169 [Oryza meyeriana var. granulata]|uniref:Uncharacterized protein n=1 Tax=Oryza meyeriana var. granulata TaxID=110450 RepID=A0A6G1CXR6_9ORYZ|nr:hypothetical protein E2562_036169 [Oryza meyeriana var. granulata]
MESESESLPAANPKKRPVEVEGPDYVATAMTGAYEISVMPKRFKFPGALNGEDCRDTGVYVRGMMMLDALERDLEAKIAARGRR